MSTLQERKHRSEDNNQDFLSSSIAIVDFSSESQKEDFRLRILLDHKNYKEIPLTISTV